MKHQSLQERKKRALSIVKILQITTKTMVQPASNQIVERLGRDPFLILVGCILSLRTKDTVSLPASLRLFESVTTPQQLVELPLSVIEKIIYPVGFYRNKARQLHVMCQQLLDNFGGRVPKTEKELLSLMGVGRKTANLVLSVGFEIPALCVDTHVHRISNRLGLVITETPEQTERALQEVLPPDLWAEYSRLLVIWGQNICVPISPLCSRCPIFDLCPKIGVGRRR